MEIIVSHNNTDLDGLAAMIAAKKLYPDTELVHSGKLHRNVKEFMALHKDTFAFKLAKDIAMDQVIRLIMVDTKNPARIGETRSVLDNPGLEIHIFDHHPQTPDDVKGSYEVVEDIGAVTTLLVEIIREKGIPINSFEATVFALGIYEDTGSLTFGTTTPRDAAAVAFLLSQGAKLSVIAEFIERPLSDEQKSLLNKLLFGSDTFDIAGAQVLVGSAETEEYVDGLALVVHKMMDVINIDVAVAVVRMEDRVHIVARSSDDVVDVSRIVSRFKGGGHPSAASAVVRYGEVEEIVKTVKHLLREHIRPEITAEEIMTAPVKLIAPDKSIDEAAKVLLRYGHTGIPVVQDGVLTGIISRRDVEKAHHHGLGHAPVKGFMSRKVVTVNRNTPLSEIQNFMIEKDIGRLPVVDNGKIVGIVSRTDVLKTLHGENYPGRHEKAYNITHPIVCVGDSVTDLLQNLPPKVINLLGKISYLADREGVYVYAVGGFVRDLILGIDNLDIDLVVEGDGPAFARTLASYICGRVRVHEKFGTAVVIMPDNFKIDVATARTEYYEYPAALPKVEESSLKQDLYRRDFTINAMAVTLSQRDFGSIIDYFGGRRDLDKGAVRILYNLSFIEDPTRILRAVRFEQRYGFKIESQTLELARSAIKSRMLTKLSADRLREELKHILGEASPTQAIQRMQELEIWPHILPQANPNDENIQALRRIPEAVEIVKGLGLGEINRWVIYLAVLVRNTGCDAAEVDEKLRLTKEDKKILTDLLCHCPNAIRKLTELSEPKFSQIASILRTVTREGFVYILAASEYAAVSKTVEDYLNSSKYNKSYITGEDIKKLGFKPGPYYKKAMDAARDARLDGIITDRQSEIEFVREYLQTMVERERS